jgi:hypothetical protein
MTEPLKAAALALADALGAIHRRLKAVEDDMPFGRQQLVIELNAAR